MTTHDHRNLIDRVLTDVASPDEFERFESLVRLENAFARDVIRHAALIGDLAQRRAKQHTKRAVTVRKSAPTRMQIALPWVLSSIAAVIITAAAVIAVYMFVFDATDPEVAPEPIRRSAPVATLIEMTGGELSIPGGFPVEGEEYSAGDYSINGGHAQFVLVNRVAVDLRGKTHLRMHSAKSVTLSRGKAGFKVPSGATGFTVHLPDQSRIVDLGTAFEVEIGKAGDVHCVVTQGRVAWIAPGTDAAPVFVDAGQRVRIVDGERVVLEGPATVSISAAAPRVDEYDIAYLPAADVTVYGEKFWTDSSNLGQTFKTGSNADGYTLGALTVRAMNASAATHDYSVRVGSVVDGSFATIAIRSAQQTVDNADGDYLTFRFDPPIELAPDTRYGFDIEMTASGSGYQEGTPNLAHTDSNTYPDGRPYNRADGDPVTMDLRDHDMIFHLDLDAAAADDEGDTKQNNNPADAPPAVRDETDPESLRQRVGDKTRKE